MKQTIYQIDAFTDQIFSGNPAAVCPLEHGWLDDSLMQSIATENNLSETAFFLRASDTFHIRWFSPVSEVDLCGHATLASAHVLFEHMDYQDETVSFSSRSGPLTVKRRGDRLAMNLPTDKPHQVELSDELIRCIDRKPLEAMRGKTDIMLVMESDQAVLEACPSVEAIRNIDARGVMVTAQGESSDFVSRFFAPRHGINEDPVTGSAHTTLVPYWSQKLGKPSLIAQQISKRGGTLWCRDLGERVEIAGQSRTYLIGDMYLQ